MAKKLSSDVDLWLERETDHVRKTLESASGHFDGNNNLTVNTLEARKFHFMNLNLSQSRLRTKI